MIELSKLPEPHILAVNADIWTKAILEKQENGLEPTKAEMNRYNQPAIKQVLIAETEGKCAYCESKILHVTFGDIEHITPKSSDLAVRFLWSNLTLACDVCNQRKSNIEGLLDPYTDNPGDYLQFIGDLVLPADCDGKGFRTYTVLALNRPALRERRYERLAYIERLLVGIVAQTDPELVEVLRQDLCNNELRDGSEFAAAVRNYVDMRAPGLCDE